MAEKKCPFCGDVFFVKNCARTCSRECGYALRSQDQTKWSKDKIIEQIKEIHDLGIPLNCSSLKKSKYSPLIPAAEKYFGGWKKAVEASGFKPLRKSWGKTTILKQALLWHNDGQKLNYYAIRKLDANFTSAVSRFFSSWDDMLTEAGVDPQRCYIEWDESKVLRIMIQQHKMGYSMNVGSTRSRDDKLYTAAKKRFGSWKNALKAANINPVPWQSKWNKKIIRRWLINMSKRSISINSDFVQKNYKGFYGAAVRCFGSWDNALKAVNINPLEVKQSSFWRPELVIRKIQERHQQNKSLYSQDMDKQYPSLKVMGKQYFGSWRKAVEASGVSYKRKSPPLFGEFILGIMLQDFFPNEQFSRHDRSLGWLVGIKGHSLELDCYCDNLKLGIEFQGPTHFKPVFGKTELANQHARDERKRRLCKDNGVTLIEVPYDDFTPKTFSLQISTLNIDHVYSKKCLDLCLKYKCMCKIGD